MMNTDKGKTMHAGDIVKFKAPQGDEAGQRFMVQEMRGERVLVVDFASPMAIKPTFVYLAADLEGIA